VADLSWADVRRRRLAAHRLIGRAPAAELAPTVGEVCGSHAQLLPSAELAIGLRVDGATRTTVRSALWQERSLVKTFGLRGTVHLFPADELELWLTALRALPAGNERRQLDYLGLTSDGVDRIVEAIGDALGRAPLTLVALEAAVADRLGASVGEKRGEAFGSGWSLVRSMVPTACLRGLACFGPNDGQRVTYIRPAEWLGSQAPVPTELALATLVRRYLAAFGPATEVDFREWTATSTAAAQAAFDTVRDELIEVRVEGRRGWWVEPSLDLVGDDPPGSIVLLPHFDVYLVGSRPRDVIVPPRLQAAVAVRGLKRYDLHATVPVLVVEGEVAGLWTRTPRSRSVTIRVEPLVELTAALREGIEAAAERVGFVLGLSPVLEIGRVEARPHL
jgi:hypothetical protein